MMDLADPSTLLLALGLAALVVWRMYSRIRLLLGRQRLSPVRAWATVFFLPLLVGLLLLVALPHLDSAFGLAGGVLAGCGLAWYGLRLTKFEQTPLGRFYTPNAGLGMALAMLLIGRLAYRGVQLYSASGSIREDPGQFVRSPVTLFILGILAGYYVFYAIGLLRWKRRLRQAGSIVAP